MALVAITVGGAGLWYVRSLPRPVEVRAAAASSAAGASATSSPDIVPILVDVAGWVRSPGVYEFHDGDRVIDAIEAAGGARRGAALDALNLAAPLADGTQILVLRRQASGSAPSVDGSTTSSKVNINSASAVELEALPGIGEVIAQEILDYRTENGPFGSVDDLLDVSGIGEVTLENIRDLVTV
ncbi:MAG TPA: ComEA family DNA-binding protein [Actinomycetota bacterium]